ATLAGSTSGDRGVDWRRSAALVGDGLGTSPGRLGVEVLPSCDERPQVLVEAVDERYASGDVQPDDVLVADAVEMLDHPAQAVAVCRDQDGLAGPQVGHDRALPVGQHPHDDV